MKMYKLLGADGKEYLSETPGTFGGNGKLKIYGRLDCPSALSTIRRFPGTYEKSRVFFADEKTALAAGYRPCGNCLREKYREYKENRRSTVKSLDYDWMIVTVSVYGLKDTRWDEYGSLAVYPSC